MAKKAVGRVGKALIEPMVTGGDGRTLPKPRVSRKLTLAKRLFERQMAVDFQGVEVTVSIPSPDEFYDLLQSFGYKWDGEHWSRKYPEWVKVEI